MNKKIRSYTELSKLKTFEERFNYLRLDGAVGFATFAFDRYLNQDLYSRNKEWKRVRELVIRRDMACDLGIEDREIGGRLLVHHMNPITEEQILNHDESIFDPEYLITVSHNTHNAIHYSNESILVHDPITRKANDTCPWRT